MGLIPHCTKAVSGGGPGKPAVCFECAAGYAVPIGGAVSCTSIFAENKE